MGLAHLILLLHIHCLSNAKRHLAERRFVEMNNGWRKSHYFDVACCFEYWPKVIFVNWPFVDFLWVIIYLLLQKHIWWLHENLHSIYDFPENVIRRNVDIIISKFNPVFFIQVSFPWCLRHQQQYVFYSWDCEKDICTWCVKRGISKPLVYCRLTENYALLSSRRDVIEKCYVWKLS